MLDHHAPSRPGIVYLPTVQPGIIETHQFVHHITHPKEMQPFTAAALAHSNERFLIDEKKSVCIAAQLARLSIKHRHLFQILLRMRLVPQAEHQCLEMSDSLLFDCGIIP